MAEPGAAGRVFAPDAIMDGVLPERPVVIFDRILVRLATLSRRTRPSAVREALDAGKPIGNGLGVDIPETANCIRRHAEAQHKLHDQIAPLAPDALA